MMLCNSAIGPLSHALRSHFFRAWVCYRNISPITSKPDVKKRPRSWIEGQQELHRYQMSLKKAGVDVKPKIEPVEEVSKTSIAKENFLK